ncbi:hypothetical protein [Inediibacterium massiliense]|uniref:hypothetical protein n=1 Tax=Inediibacterium massiliense TaxID=1658111 RepID=UPI0006B63402|nr:hypothetical protein [Inediibacterium massiliense]
MWDSRYLIDIITPFLPSMARIIVLETPFKRPAVGMVDLDGDGILELIGAYNWQGENYIIVLKYYCGAWGVADIVKGKNGIYELVLWIHDTGDAYKDSTTYWYYLTDAQIKTGDIQEALKSIDRALEFEYPYPSREELLRLRRQLCQYNPFKNQDGIDFSSVKYVCSEKEKDIKLEKALVKEFDLDQCKDHIRYYYNKVDLNGDENLEVFAYLVGFEVCGTGGCSAAIFKKKNEEYELLSRFSLVNNPVIISNSKTKGYRDIIMNVYGGGIESFFALMKYDGTTYPSNPSIQPKVEHGAKVEGIAIIADDIAKNPGIELQMPKN